MNSNQSKRIPEGTLVTFHKSRDNIDEDENISLILFNDPKHNIVFAQGKCINLSNQTIRTEN